MKIKILTEGGSGIGLGHISRCKALYDQALSQGYDVQLLVNTTDKSIEMLNEIKVDYVNWRDSNFIVNNIEDDHYLIVDSYLTSEDIYKLLVKQSAHCLILDDFNRISYPTKSTVVNMSLEKSKVEDNYYSGRDYIILREPFANPIHKEINHLVRRVFITLGGAGDRESTLITNDVATAFPNIKFYVLKNDQLDSHDDYSNIHVLTKLDSKAMMEQILNADIVITAAGQTMFEVIKTQTPFIAMQTVDNQINNVTSLIKSHIEQHLINSNEPNIVESALLSFEYLLYYENRMSLSTQLKGFIDGLGSERIIDVLMAGEKN